MDISLPIWYWDTHGDSIGNKIPRRPEFSGLCRNDNLRGRGNEKRALKLCLSARFSFDWIYLFGSDLKHYGVTAYFVTTLCVLMFTRGDFAKNYNLSLTKSSKQSINLG